MYNQSIISLIEDQIKQISVFEVLNCNNDIQKEIRNISESILMVIEKEKINDLYMNKNDLIIDYNDNIGTLEKYNQLIKNINTYLDEKTKTFKFLEYFKLMEEYIKEMQDYGFSFNINFNEQKSSVMIFYEASSHQLVNSCEKYNKLHNNAEKFSICVLFDEKHNVWLNKRIDIKKDFYNCHQTVGGKLESGETYEGCIIREAKEESGIEIDKENLKFVCYDDYFSNFGKKIFKCAIFVYYTNEIPINREPEKQDDWFKIDINLMMGYKLTDSLSKYYNKIKQTIIEYDTQNNIIDSTQNNTQNIKKKRKKNFSESNNSDNNIIQNKKRRKKKIESNNIIDIGDQNGETQLNNIIDISDNDNEILKRKRDSDIVDDNDNNNNKKNKTNDHQQYNDKMSDNIWIKQEEYYTRLAIDSI
jgi:ADP-ribose pyrophosphatase YjhB (NUDIX family)